MKADDPCASGCRFIYKAVLIDTLAVFLNAVCPGCTELLLGGYLLSPAIKQHIVVILIVTMTTIKIIMLIYCCSKIRNHIHYSLTCLTSVLLEVLLLAVHLQSTRNSVGSTVFSRLLIAKV